MPHQVSRSFVDSKTFELPEVLWIYDEELIQYDCQAESKAINAIIIDYL